MTALWEGHITVEEAELYSVAICCTRTAGSGWRVIVSYRTIRESLLEMQSVSRAGVSRLECYDTQEQCLGQRNGKHKCPQVGAYLLLQMGVKRPLWPEVSEGLRVTQGGGEVQVQEELERKNIMYDIWTLWWEDLRVWGQKATVLTQVFKNHSGLLYKVTGGRPAGINCSCPCKRWWWVM